jgi:hypothetical protein
MALIIKSTHKLSNGMSITDAYLMVDQQASATTKNVLVIGCKLFASKEARDLKADPLVIAQTDPLSAILNPIEKELSVALATIQVSQTTVNSAVELFQLLSSSYYFIVIEAISTINSQLPEAQKIVVEPFQD